MNNNFKSFMKKRLESFYKWPIIQSCLFSLLITALFMIILTIVSDRADFLDTFLQNLMLLALLGLFIVYPAVLTLLNLIFLIFRSSNVKAVQAGKKIEIITIILGSAFTVIYLMIGFSSVTFSEWQVEILQSQKHIPISRVGLPAVITLLAVGFLGYVILRIKPLKKLPPLITVLGISAMYLGAAECIIWIVQIFRPEWDSILLILFPVNCLLIGTKTMKELILQWKRDNILGIENENISESDSLNTRDSINTSASLSENKSISEQENIKANINIEVNTNRSENEKINNSPLLRRIDNLLNNSYNWPWIAFLLVIPLLGILLVILALFGQAPDSLVKAWTETADWNLSQRIAPQSLYSDGHYLCTVAAGGHEGVVKPLRLGRRHGHEVIVNRQLCIANAFEQILEERIPHVHKFVRYLYDKYGYPVARHIRTPFGADIVYFIMKPAEWIFLGVIYLCDSKPENRIAVQYLPPRFPDK